MDGRGHVDPSGKGWIPGPDLVRRELLPGPTSVELEESERGKVALFFLTGLAVGIVGGVLAFLGWPAGIALIVLGVLIFVIPIIPLTRRYRARRQEEHDAGYTLSRSGPRECDFVDPATGFVFRAAGEPPLTRAQYQAQLHKSQSQSEAG
jgi:hypothetical protein